jgi:DNA-binding CsgD family transcriptional regulator
MQPALTPIERQVALLAVWGGTTKQIAELLDSDTPRVERQLERIYRKLGVNSRSEFLRQLDAGSASLLAAALSGARQEDESR